MQWCELTKKKEAPQKGWILAYTRKKVIFHSYESLEFLDNELNGEDILELHLFDRDREYRCLISRSKRFEAGRIEILVDFPEEDETDETFVYKEKLLLDKNVVSDEVLSRKVITVLNLVRHEENGMAVVDNYRLKM